MAKTRSAAAVPQRETNASSSKKRTKPSENSGRNKGSTKKTLISHVTAAFQKLVDQGLNTQGTANKKTGVIKSIAGHHCKAKGKPFDANKFDLREVFRSIDGFLKLMQDTYKNDSTRATNLSYVISLFDVLGSKVLGVGAQGYDAVYDAMTDAAEKRNKTRDEQDTVDDIGVTWEQILAVEHKLREDDYASERHTIVALLTLMPPRRSDYSTLRFWNTLRPESDKRNFVVVPDNTEQPCSLQINDYKTSKSYGMVIIKMSEDSEYSRFFTDIAELNKIIREYAQRKNLKNGDFFFKSSTGTARAGRFQGIVKDAFLDGTGANIGIRFLRHAYSTRVAQGPPLSVADQKRVAYLMAHDVVTHLGYRQHDTVLRDYQEREAELADLRARAETGDLIDFDHMRLIDALKEIAALSRNMTRVIEGVLADS